MRNQQETEKWGSTSLQKERGEWLKKGTVQPVQQHWRSGRGGLDLNLVITGDRDKQFPWRGQPDWAALTVKNRKAHTENSFEEFYKKEQ